MVKLQEDMAKERGFSPIFLFVVIILVMLGISILIGLGQMIICVTCGTAEKIPVIGWIVGGVAGGIKKVIPLGLAGIIDAIIGMADWSLQRKFLAPDVTVTSLAQQTGWTTVRDLANMAMVLGLVIIAICIILGIREFEAKRTLPIFILIALLINFTPVICGFIIDLSDKVTSWLAKGGISTTYAQKVENEINNNPDKYCDFFTIFLFALFMLIAAIVYFMYFLLFIIRFVYLLLLVIISPLAFASRIFPPSDKVRHFFPKFLHWDGWWNEFLTWCTIGFFGAFFLMQANNLFELHITGSSITGDAGILGDIILYFLPILFLLIGFFVALQTAQGVAAVTMIASGVFLGGMALKSFGGKMGAVSRRKRKELEAKREAGEKLTKREWATLQAARVGEAPTRIAYWAQRRIPFAKKKTPDELLWEERRKQREEAKKLTNEELVKELGFASVAGERRESRYLEIVDRGPSAVERLKNEVEKGTGKLKKENVMEDLKNKSRLAREEGRYDDAQRLTALMYELNDGRTPKGIGSVWLTKDMKREIAAKETKKDIKDVTEEDIKNLDEETLNREAEKIFLQRASPELLARTISRKTAQSEVFMGKLTEADAAPHVLALSSRFGTEFTKTFQGYIEKRFDKVGEQLHTVLNTTTAHALGLRVPKKIQELEASIDTHLEKEIEKRENVLKELKAKKAELPEDSPKRKELQDRIENTQKEMQELIANSVNLHKMSGSEMIELANKYGIKIEMPKEEEEIPEETPATEEEGRWRKFGRGMGKIGRRVGRVGIGVGERIGKKIGEKIEERKARKEEKPKPPTTQRIKEIEKEIGELEKIKKRIKGLEGQKETISRSPYLSPEDKQKERKKLDTQISKILQPRGIKDLKDLKGKIEEMQGKKQELIDREIKIRKKIKELKERSSLKIKKEIEEIDKELQGLPEKETESLSKEEIIKKREELEELRKRLNELAERKERQEKVERGA